MLLRALVVVAGLAGAVAASQVPELMQQYRQRLGGAVGELVRVIEDFDADAAGEGLTRQEALARYAASPDSFLRRRGVSMERTLARFERIVEVRRLLLDANALERPVLLATYRDREVLRETVDDFRPAVPATAEGAVYAFLGFAAGASVMALLLALLAGMRAAWLRWWETPPRTGSWP